MKLRLFVAAFAAAAAVPFVLSASPASAQSKMAPAQKMTPAGKMAQKMAPVYVCKECKQYTDSMMAKKMGYKDPMGHKLVKMAKAPEGYAKMGKMGKPKMGDGKMSDGKMGKMDTMPKSGGKM